MRDFYGAPPLFSSSLPARIRQNFQETQGQDPKSYSANKVLHQPEDDPKNGYEKLKSEYLARRASSPDFIRRFPTLTTNLTNKDFVMLARNDMGNLVETEGFFNQISNAWKVARDTVAIGNMGTRAMLDDRDLYPYERRKIRQAREFQRAHMASDPGWFAAGSELAGTMLEIAGSALAASRSLMISPATAPFAPIAAGIAAYNASFNLEGGNLYAELQMDGYTPSEAADIAIPYGMFIAGLDFAGLHLASKGFQGLRKGIATKVTSEFLRTRTKKDILKSVGKGYLTAVLGESGTEGLQEITTEQAKYRASYLYRPEKLYEPEYWEAFSHAFSHTFKGMVVLGGFGASARLAVEAKRYGDAKTHEREGRKHWDIKSRSKAPEAQDAVDREAGEDSLNSSVWIDAEMAKATIDAAEKQEKKENGESTVKSEIDEKVKGFVDRVNEKAEEGGRVSILRADFDRLFGGTRLGDAILNHTSGTEEGMTKLEVDLFEKVKDKRVQEAREADQEALDLHVAFEEELAEIRVDLIKEIQAIQGPLARSVMGARSHAALLLGVIRRNARVSGLTPKEYYEKRWPGLRTKVLSEGKRDPLSLFAEEDLTAEQKGELKAIAKPLLEAQKGIRDINTKLKNLSKGKEFDDLTAAKDKLVEESKEYAKKYGELVAKYNPVTPYEASPEPNTTEQMKTALSGNLKRKDESGKEVLIPKSEMVGIPSKILEEGELVGLRLDIPAYTGENSAWVVTVHESGGKGKVGTVVGYESVAHVKAPTGGVVSFEMVPIAAAQIAAGEVTSQKTGKTRKIDKSPIATVEGEWVPTTPEKAREFIDEELSNPESEWSQVGIDPKRHQYFYDRTTGERVVSAEEVVQVGPLVIAKNVKTGDKGFLYSQEAVAELFSALTREIGGLETKSMKASGWKQTLQGLVNKGKIKKDEVFWSGIEHWLDLQEGKITKEAVQEYLELGGVRIVPVGKGAAVDPALSEEAEDAVGQVEGDARDLASALGLLGMNDGYSMLSTYAHRFREEREQLRSADSWANYRATYREQVGEELFDEQVMPMIERLADARQAVIDLETSETKYGDYVLPGGKNYREVLLTLPQMPGVAKPLSVRLWEERAELLSEVGATKDEVAGATAAERPAAKAKMQDVAERVAAKQKEIEAIPIQQRDQERRDYDAATQGFKSPHWDKENVVAHIRMNERTDADGNRVLFIEEIQSDWAQKGRDQGFQRTVAPVTLKVIGQPTVVPLVFPEGGSSSIDYEVLDGGGNVFEEVTVYLDRDGQLKYPPTDSLGVDIPVDGQTVQDAENAIRERFSENAFITGVPAAPFVTSTKGWLNLALKQIVLMATNEGFDRVAFVDGQTSADRYDLSKKVDSIEVQPIPAGEVSRSVRINLAEVGDAIDVEVSPDGIMSVVQGGRYGEATDSLEGKPLEDAVGKELAEKIMGVSGDPVVLAGEDLKVGGRGMKKFYDEILPQNAKKMVKKLGGKTTQTDVADLDNAFTIEVTPEMREAVAEGLPLFAKEGKKKILGTAKFDPNNEAIVNILLDPDAKPTTLMHELMHWNLEEMTRMGLDIETRVREEGYEATFEEAQMLGDVEELLKWSGFKGTLAEWRAMKVDDRRPFHEAIAVSFEKYLYEGKAPTKKLQGIFDRLLDYIGRAFEALVIRLNEEYKAEFGRDLPGLNDDVRAIFGRMMSAERDVDAFRSMEEIEAMTVSKEEYMEAGGQALTDEEKEKREAEWNEYNEALMKEIETAKAELTIARLEEVGYQIRVLERTGRKHNAETKKIIRQTREEMELLLRILPVHQIQGYIRSNKYFRKDGTLVEDQKSTGSRKLNRAQVEAISPELAKVLSAANLLSKDGVPVDGMAAKFGYESGEQMVRALAEAESLKDAVEEAVNKRILAEHTNLLDPIVMDEKIRSAVHNRIRRRIVALELKFLSPEANSRQEVNELKEAAKIIIDKKPNGEVDLAAYNRNSARARKEARKALKEGDVEAARMAKRKELLNEFLFSEGKKAREETRKLINQVRQVFKAKSDKATAKVRDITIANVLRGVLSKFGVGGERAAREYGDNLNTLLQDLASEHPGFHAEIIDKLESFLTLAKKTDGPVPNDRRTKIEKISVRDVRSLRFFIKEMWSASKKAKEIEIGELKSSVEEGAGLAVDALEENHPIDAVEEVGAKPFSRFWSGIVSYATSLLRFEHLFRRIDGFKDGIWSAMFRAIKGGGNKYRLALRDFIKKFEGMLKELNLELPGGPREITAFGYTFGLGGGHATKSEILHAAIHFFSNSSNRSRLVEGFRAKGLAEGKAELANVTEDQIREFFNRMIAEKVLTEADFQFMNKVWETLNEEGMLGAAQKVFRKIKGFNYRTIEAEPSTVEIDGKVVELSGGYIPVRYEQGATSEKVEVSLENLNADLVTNIFPQVGSDFSKERTGSGGMLKLDLFGITEHASHVYRFIHMAEAVRNVGKVIGHPSVRKAFVARHGEEAYKRMEAWLKRSGTQESSERVDDQISLTMQFLSRSANMAIMFLNIPNAIQNYTGLIFPMRDIGAGDVLSASSKIMFTSPADRGAIYKMIASKSKEMAVRFEQQIFEIYGEVRETLIGASLLQKGQSFAKKWAYIAQTITQNHVDAAIWMAAYNKTTREGLNNGLSDEDAEAQAIVYADSMVARTQMAGNPEDIASFETKVVLRALFPFKSWFINWANNTWSQYHKDKMGKEGMERASEMFVSYIYLLAVPAFVAQAISMGLKGQLDDEDDDGWGDDILELIFRSQLQQLAGGLPGVAEAYRGFEGKYFDDNYFNGRMPTAPWVDAIDNAMSAPKKFWDNPGMKSSLNVLDAFGSVSGIPFRAFTDRAEVLLDVDEMEDTGTVDYLRALGTGRLSRAQRGR